MNLISEFLTYKQHNDGCSPRTVDKYLGYLQRLEAYAATQRLPISELEPDHLNHFAGLHLHGEGLTPSSRRVVVAAIRGFYAWLHRRGITSRNSASGLVYPRSGRPLPVAMPLKYAEHLLMAPGIDTFLGLRDTTMIAFLVGCGMRISGLVSMNESDLMFISEGSKEELVVKVTEKGSKERLIPAPADCWALLRAYLGHPELREMDRTLKDGDHVLWVTTRNRLIPADQYHGDARRISSRSFLDRLKQYGEQADIPAQYLHPHAMRHLYGTELAEQDVDLLRRQALLGHSDPKSTEIYTHLAMRQMRKTVDQANPLTRIRTPVTDLLKEIHPDH